ncbi:MAG: hypothetical protein KJ072_03230, partial [Verrucomicrobia bacterium]|nr:hypothetical protein [Verrucomicrobiota bacterium]
WFLGGEGGKRFRIPPNTVVPGNGYHVFYEQQFNATPGGPDSFALNSAYGDTVHLLEADGAGELTGRRATADFGASANGVSLGRIQTSVGVDYATLVERSFGVDHPTSLVDFRQGQGAPNARPRIGPVVIQEIMYHPAVSADAEWETEFVELHNFGVAEVTLYDEAHPNHTWKLSGDIRFDFPPGSRLAGGELLVLVAFDPNGRPDLAAAFRERYAVPAAVSLLGPYAGTLSNAGGRVELLEPDRPQGPTQPDAGYVPYLVVDRVHYGDDWPWPPEADGSGASLERRAPHLYGNEPLHWKASVPSAGRANPDPADADTDRDGTPDDWESVYGLDPLDPADAGWDGDGDGQSNLAEYLAGTDPADPADVLQLRYEVNEWTQLLWFRAQPGRSYSVQYSEDLAWGVWLPVLTIEPADTVREIVVDTAEPPLASQRWYRVVMPAQP